MIRLAIVSSHPIQYNAPLFKLLANDSRFSIKVFYTLGQGGQNGKYDPGFGRVITWDIPLTEGYDHCFLKNVSLQPGTNHFKGIINPSIVEDITAWKPSALLVYGWSFASHLQCIRFFHKKIPVLFRGDSTLLDEKAGMKQIARRLFLRWVYSHVDKALYVGTHNKEYFLKHGVAANRLVYAPHAVDNRRFSANEDLNRQKAEVKRAELGVVKDDILLVFAGKLEPKKNPLFLQEVLKKIPAGNLKVLFTGNGILENTLKETLKNEPRAVFLDFQNQQAMPVIYRMADLFVLPSTGPGETWGLAVNEAMACGVAVAASDKTGCAIDLIRHNENGFLIRNNDPASFCEFVQKVLNDKEILAAMGKAGQKMIAGYSFEKVAAAVSLALQPALKD